MLGPASVVTLLKLIISLPAGSLRLTGWQVPEGGVQCVLCCTSGGHRGNEVVLHSTTDWLPSAVTQL